MDRSEATEDTPEKRRLSDAQLEKAVKIAKWGAVYSAGCVIWWAGGIALGGAALGLKAAGVAIPAILGKSLLTTSTILEVKSVILQQVCQGLHDKGLKTLNSRRAERGEPPLKEQNIAPPRKPGQSRLAAIADAFNPKSIVRETKAQIQMLKDLRDAFNPKSLKISLLPGRKPSGPAVRTP